MLTINIHHHHHYKDLEEMSYALEDIRREVEEAKTVQGSAVALIKGLRDSIQTLVERSDRDVAGLKADLASLAQDLSAASDGLTAAVAANTTPDPVPPAEPVPVVRPADPVDPPVAPEKTELEYAAEAEAAAQAQRDADAAAANNG